MSPQSNRAALPLSGQENAGWPDGSTGDSERPEGGSASGAMVVPLARSLAILTAFRRTSRGSAIRNRDRDGHSRADGVADGPLARHARLSSLFAAAPQVSAGVLSLGYAAIAHSNVQLLARLEMQAFANANETYVMLGTRDRLDVIVLETCASKQASIDLKLYAGTRLRIASSPMGWALLAALPGSSALPAGQHRTQDGPGVAEPAPPHQ